MIWYKYIFLKFYHSLSSSLGFESVDPRPTLSKWLLLLWYEGYQELHNGVGSHCPAQLSPSVEFKPRNFESHKPKGWGRGEGWSFFRFREGRGPGNKRVGVLSPSFWKTGCMPQYYQISWLPNKYKFFKKWLQTAKILQKRLSNEWVQTEDLRKQDSIWKNSNWMETDASGQSTFEK